jgi:hypothetical protein
MHASYTITIVGDTDNVRPYVGWISRELCYSGLSTMGPVAEKTA